MTQQGFRFDAAPTTAARWRLMARANGQTWQVRGADQCPMTFASEAAALAHEAYLRAHFAGLGVRLDTVQYWAEPAI